MADTPEDRQLEEDFPAFWDRLLRARDEDRVEFDRLFGILVESWTPYLEKLAGQSAGDVGQALHGLSGFCQDAWLKVAVALSQFGNAPGRHRTRAEFKGWVRKILLNAVYETNRREKRHGPDAGHHDVPADRLADRDGADGPGRVEADDELARLAAVVAVLSPEDRALLARWQRLGSYAAVAREIDVSEYHAKEQIRRVFARIQELWRQP